jgi:tRNA pseudouridine38-40 synthase
MIDYVLEVMYDGTQFHGSQVQGITPTVQLAINTALSTLLRTPIDTIGASRTDEGVHALANYYQFALEQPLPPDIIYKLNAILPGGVAVRAIYLPAKPDFNPRFDAVKRRYRYRIYHKKNPFLQQKGLFYPFPLNLAILDETAAIIKEYTQFESFAKRNSQTFTFNCTIFQSYWEQRDNELQYVVEANRFLRGMVRGLVCTQLTISRKGAPADLRSILDARDCTKAFFNVAGHGLYLEAITYPEGALTLIS